MLGLLRKRDNGRGRALLLRCVSDLREEVGDGVNNCTSVEVRALYPL